MVLSLWVAFSRRFRSTRRSPGGGEVFDGLSGLRRPRQMGLPGPGQNENGEKGLQQTANQKQRRSKQSPNTSKLFKNIPSCLQNHPNPPFVGFFNLPLACFCLFLGVVGEDLAFLELDPLARRSMAIRARQKRMQQHEESFGLQVAAVVQRIGEADGGGVGAFPFN